MLQMSEQYTSSNSEYVVTKETLAKCEHDLKSQQTVLGEVKAAVDDAKKKNGEIETNLATCTADLEKTKKEKEERERIENEERERAEKEKIEKESALSKITEKAEDKKEEVSEGKKEEVKKEEKADEKVDGKVEEKKEGNA